MTYMTTTECTNFILMGARPLLICALFKTTFEREKNHSMLNKGPRSYVTQSIGILKISLSSLRKNDK